MTFEVRDGWLFGDLYGVPVERKESPRPGGQDYIRLTDPKSAIVHTTQGSSVSGAWNTLNDKGAAPHVILGEGIVLQTRPLWAQAATLVTHTDAGFYANSLGWQAECVGFSSQVIYTLPASTWGPLVAWSAFLHYEKGVPLARPNGWEDNGSDIGGIWAANNSRRQSEKAIGFRGFIGHLDVPRQDPTWHWDPGALNYSRLFEAVEEIGEEMGYREFKAGIQARRADVVKDPDWPDDKKFGWNFADESFRRPKPDGHVHNEFPSHTHSGTVEVS